LIDSAALGGNMRKTRWPLSLLFLAAIPRLGAADRQNMYDSLLLSTAVLAMVHQSGDKASSKTIARQALQQIGLNE
ncbi:MAG TPA: hypothetical protein VJR29_07375, partial [bacterium]|nr:hypothetical protein [bacterium]